MLQSIENTKSRSEIASTKTYYERNARQYFEATVHADVSALYERFLTYVPPGGRIMDAGSGSGRDTLALLKRGYALDAFDISPALAALSTRLTGVRTQVKGFEDLEDSEQYDGIWACAALLHVPENDLPGIMVRLARALRPGSALYVSFKHGQGERLAADGRRFTDMEEPRLRDLIQSTVGFLVKEIWITQGEDNFKGRDSWVNAIALKSEG